MTTDCGPDPAFAASPSSLSTQSRPSGLQSGVGSDEERLDICHNLKLGFGGDRAMSDAADVINVLYGALELLAKSDCRSWCGPAPIDHTSRCRMAQQALRAARSAS